nr:MAG TPA: hypothetical protein [Caudoviricetes sp.]
MNGKLQQKGCPNGTPYFFCRQINVKIYMLFLMIFVYNHTV